MVDDYLSDREQEEALRRFWRENWRWIVGGVVIGLLGLAGFRYYESYRHRMAEEAGGLYEELKTAIARPDIEQATSVLTTLVKEHRSSGYTQQGRLLVAKAHVEAGKFDEAIELLRAVAQDSDDEELAQVAQLRLARLLIQQGKHDEALQLLKPDKAGLFAGQMREVRGDALYAKGDHEGARAEYAAALADPTAVIDRGLLEAKLQDVGGSAVPPALQGVEE